MLKFCMIIFLVNLSNSFSQENKQNIVPIMAYEKIELESKIKILEIENEELKKISKKMEKEIEQIKKEQKKEIRREFKSQDLGVVYNIDQIYKNANEYYENAFKHLVWIVGIIGTILVGLLGLVGYAQYLFRKSEKKELDRIEAQMTSRIDNFQNNIIEKAQEKSQSFFMNEEKKLKDEIEETKKKQDIELDKLKEINLYFEFKFEFISIQTFEQRTNLRLEKLEQLLENEKYKELDNFDVLYHLEKEYREKYLSRDYDENFGDKYIQLYKKILENKNFKEKVGEKYKEILATYIQVLNNFKKIYELERIINKEKEYVPEKAFKILNLWVNIKLKRKDNVLNLIKEVDLKDIFFDSEEIDYIISILDSSIDSIAIETLKQKKSEGE